MAETIAVVANELKGLEARFGSWANLGKEKTLEGIETSYDCGMCQSGCGGCEGCGDASYIPSEPGVNNPETYKKLANSLETEYSCGSCSSCSGCASCSGCNSCS